MLDIVAFGEVQLRLSTPHFQRFEQASSYDVNVGGAGLALPVPTGEVGTATDGLHFDFCQTSVVAGQESGLPSRSAGVHYIRYRIVHAKIRIHTEIVGLRSIQGLACSS